MQRADGPTRSARTVVVGLVVAAAAIGALAWFLRRPAAHDPATGDPAMVATTTPSASLDRAGEGPRAGDGKTPGSRVLRVGHVTAERRSELARRIEEARARRAAPSAPAGPKLPGPPPETEISATSIMDAMKEVKPFLAECYTKHAAERSLISVKSDLMLTGDPDIGTIIDADQILDVDGHQLPAAFDDCLRSTLMSLELPPLAEGSKVKVSYSFQFANEPGRVGR